MPNPIPVTPAIVISVKQTLNDLAKAARDAYEEETNAVDKSLQAALKCGQALMAAKEKVKGEKKNWLDWLENNTKIPERTARRRIYIAKNWDLFNDHLFNEGPPGVVEACYMLNAIISKAPADGNDDQDNSSESATVADSDELSEMAEVLETPVPTPEKPLNGAIIPLQPPPGETGIPDPDDEEEQAVIAPASVNGKHEGDGNGVAAKDLWKEADKQFGKLVRCLAAIKLYEKYRTVLDPINKDLLAGKARRR